MNTTIKQRSTGATLVLAGQVLLLAIVLPYVPSFLRAVGFWSGLFFATGYLLAIWRWGVAVRNGTLTTGVCWSFWIVFLCVTPLIQVSLNSFPWQQTLSVRMISNTLVLLTISTFALWIGEAFGEARIHNREYMSNKVESSKHTSSVSKEDTLVKVFSVLGLLVTAYCFMKIGVKPFMSTRYDFTVRASALLGNATTSPLILALSNTLTAICGMYWLLKIKRIGGIKYRFWCLLTLPIAVFVANPIINPRFVTWTVLGAFGLTYMRFTRNSRALTVLALPLALIILFPALDYFRDSGPTRNTTTLGNLKVLTTNGDYDAFQMLGNVVSWTGQHGLQFGHQLLGIPFLFVPRTIWQSKPQPTGPMVSQDLGYGFTNLSSPLPSEGYVDFGILGLIAVCILWGWMMVKLDQKMLNSIKRNDVDVILCIITYFAIYQVILIRGSLIGCASRLFPALLMLIFWPLATRNKMSSKPRAALTNSQKVGLSRT